MERDEIDVRPGVHHGREFGEMEAVPFAQAFDDRVLLFLDFIERAHRLTEMVFRSDRLPHPDLREADHRIVEEVAAVAERLRIEERGRLPSEVAARAFEARFQDEDVIGESHEFPLFREDFPVIHEGEALREGLRLFRQATLLASLTHYQVEADEPSTRAQL